MTTALLICFVFLGLGALFVSNRPGLWTAIRERVLPTGTPEEIRARMEEQDDLFRTARHSFEKAASTTRKGSPVDSAAAAQIAAVNVFVEKAQVQLTRHAVWCILGATCFVLMDVVVATLALMHLTAAIGPLAGWQQASVVIVQSILLAGFAAAVMWPLTLLARAFFREAAATLEKRHSLRMGRLYVQLKALSTPEPGEPARSFTDTELLRAFGLAAPAPAGTAEAEPRTPPVRLRLRSPRRRDEQVETLPEERKPRLT
ncbi:conserved membrane protein of unknown function [Rhodovastum atsumiense]|uniref:Uncharacterized protein n=1 Tax=Rhodovastum atsumiense TaxID=504468 RepID=A0A5M6IT74_9PROT|nr:hypothetical protein [Rhodovastum atsumiense]KAA5611516.1 hypothetical protein F1189_14415 [Rhodovastum atsumiense]CAH2601216.1 conserved membrane protein of unknown function [Rhodovastum atsumiense]